ncbi:MAG TPA: Gfo/Idh/MocA family oxidoreductase [Bryobacteraceae bacterium]|nr:Gfo/Idh/MocA family oxidoreductase [Bryobacteraceae bacterium]
MFSRLPFVMLAASLSFAADLKLGIIGTDTSHVIAFTKVLNDPANPDHIAGARIVAAFKGGSPDVESSANRVEGFAKELQEKWRLELVPSISDLCGKVDAILLESVDGRKHLPQVKEAARCGKPMFIDKPLASTLDEAREIARVLKAANVKWFSTSSLRYGEVAVDMKFPDMTGATVWGPGPTEEHHPLSLSWYGIHAVEMLYALLGPGAQSVSMMSTPDSDEVTATWKGGKLGTVRTIRPYSDFGGVVFRPKAVVPSGAKTKSSYVPMLKEIVKFFQTGVVPVPNEVTLEMFAFMDAAERSKAQGGAAMKLR